ncbi:unnamed protein product [Cuscuta europaea]|uniref:Uncharacterized protein n=1 Tax=Cuscuta europaea TaxID=41803 RepID=A0A9P1EDI5_CUSEU|nr:unnamed protein product [Cuscuta europaea]
MVALSENALLGALVLAVSFFYDKSPSSDANTRRNYIQLILKISIGFTSVAFVGAEILFVVGYVQLQKGEICGTPMYLKILRGAAGLCFVQFVSALVYGSLIFSLFDTVWS